MRSMLVGEVALERGSTPGWIQLSRTKSGVFILNLLGDANPENRWIDRFNLSIMRAFEAIEVAVEEDDSNTPTALLTVSDSPKFWSNGIDPTGAYTKALGLETPSAAERLVSGAVTMFDAPMAQVSPRPPT